MNKEATVLLRTGGHCIQTAAKNEFRRITAVILDSMDENLPPGLSAQLELLTEFLEKSDFSRLRASDERFSGSVDALCLLRRDKNGNPVVEALE